MLIGQPCNCPNVPLSVPRFSSRYRQILVAVFSTNCAPELRIDFVSTYVKDYCGGLNGEAKKEIVRSDVVYESAELGLCSYLSF